MAKAMDRAMAIRRKPFISSRPPGSGILSAYSDSVIPGEITVTRMSGSSSRSREPARCCAAGARAATATEPVFAAGARSLVEHTDRVTKFALPSPFLIAVRYWHEDYSRDAYPTLEHFLDHLAEVLAREVRALVEAGLDIIQLDDSGWGRFQGARAGGGSGRESAGPPVSNPCKLSAGPWH